MKKRCYIAGAGDFCKNILPGKDDFVIAADGGYEALKSYGVNPDMVIGDFDSLDPMLHNEVMSHPNVLRSSSEKDDTDMMLAVKQGFKLGCDKFIINGALGGRLDQTLANIQILGYIAKKGAIGILTGKGSNVTAIKNRELTISLISVKTGVVSVFSAGDTAEGVTLKGFKYPLNNALLNNTYPIGVSNELKEKTGIISVKNGTLIIIFETSIEISYLSQMITVL